MEEYMQAMFLSYHKENVVVLSASMMLSGCRDVYVLALPCAPPNFCLYSRLILSPASSLISIIVGALW